MLLGIMSTIPLAHRWLHAFLDKLRFKSGSHCLSLMQVGLVTHCLRWIVSEAGPAEKLNGLDEVAWSVLD
jgi:hypothetical protein